jgi:TPR repeat protein
MAKDEVKALSWFIHAAANGYVESKVYLLENSSMSLKCLLRALLAVASNAISRWL